MREFTHPPLWRTLILAFASFALVVLSLAIKQTAHSHIDAQDLGFGYPLHFAYSDFTSVYDPPGYPQTYNLNPWEIPMEGNPLTFLISWLLVYSAFLGVWLVLARTIRSVFER